jgi:DNA-binding IclR family transcriptional regulator
VLWVLAENPEGLSVSELASALGTHRAGIYRSLGPLIEQRLVVRMDDGRHLLGAGLVELASYVRPRLQEVSIAHLRDLAEELSLTTALTLRDGDEAVVAAVVEPRNSDVHISYRVGLRHALDRAASGIAILAGSPPREDERAEVTLGRARGWTVSTAELLAGVTGVAAAIPVKAGLAQASISAVWIDARDPAETGERLVSIASLIAAETESQAKAVR